MALFRKILFWTHLIGGTLAGIVILVMSVTGVLLTYEKQMITWSDREYRRTPTSAEAIRLPAGDLIAAALKSGQKQPESITWEFDPEAPVALGYGREVVYANPYTGEVLGKPTTGMRTFMSEMRAWHRWLAAEGEQRAAGKAITGASNVLFLFLVVSGIYLWIPKRFTWQHLKPVTLFRGGLKGKARDFNWHNVAGIWTAVPLFFVVLSAMVISYPWFSQFVIRLADGEAPVVEGRGPGGPQRVSPGGGSPVGAGGGERRGPGGPEGRGPGGPQGGSARGAGSAPEPADLAALNAVHKGIQQNLSGWQTLSLRVPPATATQVNASVSYGAGGQPQYRETLSLNAGTGAVVSRETFESQSLGRRIRSWMRFVHTGEYYGFIGQTIAGIASAAGVLLVYSGFALAIRRFFAWRRRRQAPKIEELQRVA